MLCTSMRRGPPTLALLLVLATASPARGEPDRGESDRGEPAPASEGSDDSSTNYVNLRVGDSTVGTDYAVICIEATPWWRLSIESCGTGAGLFRDLRTTDVAHFRAKWQVLARPLAHGSVRMRLGVGFAELEVADDDPGFRFGGVGDDAAETAGPEATASIQYLAPLGRGVEAIVNVTAGMAWLPHAPDLVVPQDEWLPFVGLEVGAGW